MVELKLGEILERHVRSPDNALGPSTRFQILVNWSSQARFGGDSAPRIHIDVFGLVHNLILPVGK